MRVQAAGGANSARTTSGIGADFPVPFGGKIQVNKVLVPATDPGKFNLQIDGATAGTGDNVGDGGTTGAIAVSAGTSTSPGATHTVSEAAGTGADLASYTTTYSCAKDGTAPITGTGSGPVTLTVNKDDSWVCTFTNTRKDLCAGVTCTA